MEKKKQSGGLLRRLFGVDEEHQNEFLEEAKQERPEQNHVKSSSAQYVHTERVKTSPSVIYEESAQAETLPWEAPTTTTSHKESKVSTSKQTSGNSPTWNELLDRIAPLTATVDKAKAEFESPEVHVSKPRMTSNSPADFTAPSTEVLDDALPWETEKSGDAEPLTDPADEFNHTDNADQTEIIVPQDLFLNVVQEAAKPMEATHDYEATIKQVGVELNSPSTEKLLSEQPLEKLPIQNEHATWLMQLAEETVALGELDKAEKFLEIALILEHHPDVLLALAKLEQIMENELKAADYCFRSLELFPDTMEAYELLEQLEPELLEVERMTTLRPGTADGAAKLAKLCFNRGLFTDTMKLFTRAESLGMNMDELQFDLGILYEKAGNVTQACHYYHRNLELKGDLTTAYRLFDIYLEQGAYQDAEEIGSKYFVDSDDPMTQARWSNFQMLQAKELYESGHMQEAIAGLYKALERGNPEAKGWLIKALRQGADENWTANREKAIEYYGELLDLEGFDLDIVTKLGEAYFAAANFAKALEYWQAVYEHNADNSTAMRYLADCLHGLGQFERAAELWENLLSNGQEDRNTRERLFNYYRSQGSYEAAKKHLSTLHDPQSDAYRAGVQSLAWEHIRFLLEQGELDKAWEVCSTEVMSNPSTDMLGMAAKILFERLDKLMSENRSNEALQELLQARQLGLNGLELSLREASLYEQSGNDQAALEMYRANAEKAPEVWDKIKELYLKSATREYLAGNLPEARRLLEEAHANLPDKEEISRALGVLYQETGQFALAAALAQNSMVETEIQISTDHLNVLRPHSYRRIRLG